MGIRQYTPAAAVCVAINNFGGDGSNNLRGCLNDGWDWATYLEESGWKHDTIRIITDQAATPDAAIQRLNWLIGGAQKGDHIVFAQSSHGTQVRDRNGDELSDGKDEALCMANCTVDWDHGLILDDDLGRIIQKLPEGVLLDVILDLCHSGTATREIGPNPTPEHYCKSRYLPPPMHIAWRGHGQDHLPVKKVGRGILGWVGKRKTRGEIVVPTLNHRVWSGCRDNQTSADAYIDGKYCGALSSFLKKSLRGAVTGTARQQHANCLEGLKAGGYEQEPQLEGPSHLLALPFLA